MSEIRGTHKRLTMKATLGIPKEVGDSLSCRHKDVVKRPMRMRVRMKMGIEHSAWPTVCTELTSLCFSHIHATKYTVEPGILIWVCPTSEPTSQVDQSTNTGSIVS